MKYRVASPKQYPLLCMNVHIYKIYLSLGVHGINTKFRHQKIIPKSTGKASKIADFAGEIIE